MEGALIYWRSKAFDPPDAMAEMNSYYKWCMFLMPIMGLWPHSTKNFGSYIMASSASLLFAVFFIADRSLFQQLRDISIAAMTIVVFTKYHTFWYHINDLKAFLDEVRLDWETNNVEVLRIMQIHAFHGKRLVIYFAAYLKCVTAFFYPGMFILILYHISPIILDIIVPLNESRPLEFPIHIEFFIEKKQHPILNISLVYLAIIMDITILVGTESIMIMFSLHVAGSFGIASYYFKTAVLAESVASLHPRNNTNNETISYIATGVFFHRRAIQ
ncbi:uncharacterized protein LOC105662965 [Megachile rotundata]|uniref:uncharacterized protein LOC105662965 n=1 Tax=Megachile rotundata TaxID=143995 RepID=UPI003FD4FD6C